jgi:hypothetical protein
MTLEELDASLPNGLHDARLKKISADFEMSALSLIVEILVALPTDAEDGASAPYRDAEIVFSKNLVFATNFPSPDSAFRAGGSVSFVFNRREPSCIPPEIGGVLPEDTLKYSLYLLDWDCYLHIAACAMSFAWLSQ